MSEQFQVPYKVITTVEEISALADMIIDKPLAIDSESANLYGATQLIQLYQKHWAEVIIVHTSDEFAKKLVMTLADLASEVVFHNASYDISVFMDADDMTFTEDFLDKVTDTLYLSRLYYTKAKHFSLDKCFLYCLGFDPYKSVGIDKKLMQKKDWSKDVNHLEYTYAATDVYYLLDLLDEVSVVKRTKSYRLDIATLKDCFSWQGNGVPVSKDKITLVRQDLESQIADVPLPEDLNINSWQQVRRFLDSDESDKLFLKSEALRGNVDAGNITKKRTLIKRVSFLNVYDRSDDALVRGVFAPLARSGRLTCKHENLQQWPRELKKIIVAPEGKKLLFTDFDALEMRCIAALIKERVLLKILRGGHSPHDYVAKGMFGKGFTQEQRRVAKTENFLLLYGGGIAMLQSMLILQADLLYSFDEVSEFKRAWLELFEDIAEWHERGFNDHRHKIPWKTPYGREYLGNLGTDQLNLQIQGMGSEVAKTARLLAKDEITKAKLDEHVKMVSTKHDDYLYVVDDNPDVYEQTAEIVGTSMHKAWTIMMGMSAIKEPDVEMPIIVDVGTDLEFLEKTPDYRFKI